MLLLVGHGSHRIQNVFRRNLGSSSHYLFLPDGDGKLHFSTNMHQQQQPAQQLPPMQPYHSGLMVAPNDPLLAYGQAPPPQPTQLIYNIPPASMMTGAPTGNNNRSPPAYQLAPYGMGQTTAAPTGGSGKSAPSIGRFKKAPDAPKRFKSAFIIYSAEKHKKIKAELAAQGRKEKVSVRLRDVLCFNDLSLLILLPSSQTTDVAKLVSEAWREMPPEEKEIWEERARQDKARYEMEKAMYKGPWKVPANKRTPKDPSAPKRPMSAFLAFSNKRRASLKRQYPDASNADLSKMLSKQWKEADHELKSKYTEEEAGLRAKYKTAMAEWRAKVAEEKLAERKEREQMAMQAAEARQQLQHSENGEPSGSTPYDAAAASSASQYAAMYGSGGYPPSQAFLIPGQQPQAPFAPAQNILQANPQLLQQLLAGMWMMLCIKVGLYMLLPWTN